VARPQVAQPPVEQRLRDPELARYLTNLKSDLKVLVDFIKETPLVGAVFGSARTPDGTVDAATSEAIAAAFAGVSLPPITGAGPSIMKFVPDAFRKHRKNTELLTHGVNIVLPKEQHRNESIEHGAAMHEFLFRKLALYYPTRAVVVMPGGFGTMDELFELWAQRARGQYRAELTAERKEFYDPIIGSLRQVAWHNRQTISPKAWRCLVNTNDVDDIVRSLPHETHVKEARQPIETLAARFEKDLDDAMLALDGVPQATVVLGGRDLRPEDPTLAAARETSRLLTEKGKPMRVGNPSAIARAVVNGARQADPQAQVQGLMLRGEGRPRENGLKVLAEQTDFIIHKDMLTRHSNGLLVLPGGLGTMANFFGVLTEIQTHKRAKMPIVLLGNDFWKPFFRQIKNVMLSSERQVISPEDLDLLVFTDDPKVAAAALAGEEVPADCIGHAALDAPEQPAVLSPAHAMLQEGH
jgi:predicted Rossmann-fold nucleotide-binding protein